MPQPIVFLQNGPSQAECLGGVIMATLRALVGGGSILAFLGFVVLIPLGWALVLYTAENASAKQFKARHGMGGAYTAETIKGR